MWNKDQSKVQKFDLRNKIRIVQKGQIGLSEQSLK